MKSRDVKSEDEENVRFMIFLIALLQKIRLLLITEYINDDAHSTKVNFLIEIEDDDHLKRFRFVLSRAQLFYRI